jgi:rhamnosyltransferase
MSRVSELVTVAIPTLDAGSGFERTLAAVRKQRLDPEVELLVCDSGSADDTVSLARRYGARVIEIPRQTFSHGGTRNLLMQRSRGDHVAFLTQDAIPVDELWLGALLGAFTLTPNVGLVFGPYRAQPGASVSVVRELTAWWSSFADGDQPRIDALPAGERAVPARHFYGHLGFFTDANGCISKAAWEQVPFRGISYAEDHLLAQDMLRAGFAKVYVPTAAVIHSHDYSVADWLRRSFDESRAIREVYGWVAGTRTVARNLRGDVMADWRWARRPGTLSGWEPLSTLAGSLAHHGARAVGELLGARADRLPRSVVQRLSLEGRR